ncbi:hypothetical protein FQA39_LY09340 [Lamprigera yunnana]|nr:hypothetical protein FQA39_LY09340 [Lamprigera yunnana]
MDFVILPLIFSMVLSKIIALPTPTYDSNRRNNEGPFFHNLATLSSENNIREDIFHQDALPHEELYSFTSYNASPAPVQQYVAAVPPAPAVAVKSGLGVTVNKDIVLAPQVEIFRFLEAFVRFKTELLARLQHIINDNWELIRGVINVLIGKLQKLHGVALVFISILRQILEFAVNIFSSFSFNLPSIGVGVSGHTDPVHPSPNYGVQSILSTATNWLNG